jgi:1-deoxyxylulose-5-phosphate synthase
VQYSKLGGTGLDVSRLCLGCMSFGDPTAGSSAWTLDEAASRTIIEQALEAGINFFDTANIYSRGSSEEIVGRALADMADRDEVVIATKVFGQMRRGRNAIGLSRKAIMTELDASLRRLGTDYIDLYQIHRFDPATPIEETLRALHDAVESGKVRYIGASSMFAWQFAKMLMTSDMHGWHRFVSMQNHYNLLYREEEREMMPLCADQSVAVVPWSPLARGRLTRDWDDVTTRSETDDWGTSLYPQGDREIVEVVAAVAAERGSAACAGGPRLDAVEALHHRADRRRDQARAPGRRHRCGRTRPDGRGGASPRGGLCPACSCGHGMNPGPDALADSSPVPGAAPLVSRSVRPGDERP